VLLLNSSLTVRKDQPNSHKHLKWNLFTDAIIKIISNEKEHIVFMLWGAFAQKKSVLIDSSKHLVLTATHPSPLGANKGNWFGNKHFSKANDYLTAHKKKAINWL
ncbi:MAG TPA: uracil-DNA glycosylase, partial [Flavobacterium sp.]|nr:uracil-DNA glycosylase [Flavobacterium sp.]